ncbi:MAG: lipid-A-disaccharide synthase [Gammaproteobacteria bacterium]|nr:lipid-A-disaccharide synthase [Gammaproteobacteria bacterium]
MNKTILIVAGEASGDMHGAEIAKYLSATDSSIRCVGMGGQKMRDAGVELLYDSANIAVVGLWEVLTHWTDIKHALHTLEKYIVDSKPDLLLLIDYQEFNLRLAKFAKQHGTRVLFYISPQLWAWRRRRIKKFIARVDMMAVIFPFEVKYFEQAGIPVRYTGHPLNNKVVATVEKPDALKKFNISTKHPVIGLLPGSRQSEIQRILPILLNTAKVLTNRIAGIQFLLPVAHASLLPKIEVELAAADLNIQCCINDTYNAINCCDAVIVASGTATLEVALLNIPMAIVYRVAPLSYAILRHLVSIPYIGLANIIAGKKVIQEFVQNDARPERIADEIQKLLDHREYRQQILANLREIKHKLGDSDGIKGISQLILEILQNRVST